MTSGSPQEILLGLLKQSFTDQMPALLDAQNSESTQGTLLLCRHMQMFEPLSFFLFCFPDLWITFSLQISVTTSQYLIVCLPDLYVSSSC